jgi:hypothetical protein
LQGDSVDCTDIAQNHHRQQNTPRAMADRVMLLKPENNIFWPYSPEARRCFRKSPLEKHVGRFILGVQNTQV